jgi:hypothetical protein
MVGETFRSILIDQFTRTRNGDSQWYENQPWAPADLVWLRNTTLSDIILRNTNTVRMQADAFIAVERADLYNGSVATITPRISGVDIPGANSSGVTFKLISGTLPPGLRVGGPNIVGTPTQVSKLTTFTFCIRATQNSQIADRTFSMTVDGADAPVFVTTEGALPAGLHQQLYVLDRTYIDFQIEAFDIDTAAGQQLSFFIASGDGELPPGVTFTNTGRIYGFIRPTFKISVSDGTGYYDQSLFDAVAYDFAVRPSNGYDSYLFDNVKFDYSQPDSAPVSLNRNYEFIVSLTDGTSLSKRKYRIFVVGDDQFRADSTTPDGTAGDLYTADATYLRQASWLTNSQLGSYRANNYVTIPLEVYDDTDILFRLEATNQEIYANALQVSINDNVKNSNKLTIVNTSSTPLLGQSLTFDNYLDGATGQVYKISNVESLGVKQYRLTLDRNLELVIPDATSFYIGSTSQLPPGLSFDINTVQLYGTIPYQPAITKTYTFTVTATRIGSKGDRLDSFRTFKINVVGEIDSVIIWNTNNYLGSLNVNYESTFSIEAASTISNAVIIYTLADDTQKLPPGLTLTSDGEIVGKVMQSDVFSIDHSLFTLDKGTTTLDRTYTFIVDAKDQFNYSIASRAFTIALKIVDTVAYSSIRVKPLLSLPQRAAWRTFVNNSLVFTPADIYRPNDAKFGIPSGLDMLVYAGIQTEQAAAYMGAIGLNHKRKRFVFGSVKKAVAVATGTKTVVYEVIYVEMIDPQESKGKHLPLKIKKAGLESDLITSDVSNSIWSRNLSDLSSIAPSASRPQAIITADSTGYEASNPQVDTYFPNSITNWRTRLSQTVDHYDNNGNPVAVQSERNYLPLWMRSIQPSTKQEIGFQLALPLCYCKPGSGDKILLNVTTYLASGAFSLNSIDYTVDRYIIDSVTGSTSDKYLIFKNDRITV